MSSRTKYKWAEEYKKDREEPFDLKFAHRLLEQSLPEKKFLYPGKDLQKFMSTLDSSQPSSYLYIGNNYMLDQQNAQLMADYIGKGNTLMLVTAQVPFALKEKLFKFIEVQEGNSNENYSGEIPDTATENVSYQPYYNSREFLNTGEAWNDSIRLQWNMAGFKSTQDYIFQYYELDAYKVYNWNFVDTMGFSQVISLHDHLPLQMQVLETINRKAPGMVRIKYGKGWLVWHPNPILFTNYFLQDRQGFDYISKAFSFLNKGQVAWELYGSRYNNQANPSKSSSISKSPLKFILSQPPLRLAWYILLMMVFLFLLFRSKRMQRKIPVLEEKSNDSEEYYSTISRLYYLNRDNLHLGKLMFRHFQLVCRRKFLINIHENQKRAVEVLSKKTGLAAEAVEDILKSFGRLDNNLPLTDEELIELYMKLRTFYNQF